MKSGSGRFVRSGPFSLWDKLAGYNAMSQPYTVVLSSRWQCVRAANFRVGDKLGPLFNAKVYSLGLRMKTTHPSISRPVRLMPARWKNTSALFRHIRGSLRCSLNPLHKASQQLITWKQIAGSTGTYPNRRDVVKNCKPVIWSDVQQELAELPSLAAVDIGLREARIGGLKKRTSKITATPQQSTR